MGKAFLKGIFIGSILYCLLLTACHLGFKPALNIAIFASIPAIYIVGPLSDFLLPASLSGPPAGLVIILVSGWVEFSLFAAAIYALVYAKRSNQPLKRDEETAGVSE